MKEVAKNLGCTINDLSMTLLSISCYEFFETWNKEKPDLHEDMPERIGFFLPFSLRQPAKSIDQIEVNNDTTMLFMHLPIRKDVQNALPLIKKMTNKLKTSLLPFSFKVAGQILWNIPFDIAYHVQAFIGRKGTIIFSNVNATKEPWVICGRKMTGIYIL